MEGSNGKQDVRGRSDWRVGWEEGGKDRKVGIKDGPSIQLRGKRSECNKRRDEDQRQEKRNG